MSKTFETLLAEYDTAILKTAASLPLFGPHHGDWLRKRSELVVAYREQQTRATAYAEAFEPGKASGIIGGMFREAELRGHSPIAAKHALSFLLERLDKQEKQLKLLAENFGARVADVLTDKEITEILDHHKLKLSCGVVHRIKG